MNPATRRAGIILKVCIFATGCSGIVAEFVLSTLATYLKGNAVFQWTIVMSLMLFSMGVGSRLSKLFKRDLLDTFILTEFALSILSASSAIVAYGLAAQIAYVNIVIYCLALVIGGLIGFEIPLVTRLNEQYEELRSNIATIMEKDYYGSLVGGLFFAFFALPHLGLTYTPIVLGSVNFLVASLLLWSFFGIISRRRTLSIAFGATCALLGLLFVSAKPIILFGEQQQYRDKIIYTRQTPYQKIVMTQWKEHYWLYINGQVQFSSYDEERYHEPLVHPAMNLRGNPTDVLVLGGGDGLALREIWKYPSVQSVTLVDLDPVMTQLAASHPVLVEINQGSMRDPRLTVVNRDAAAFLREDGHLYGVVIIDLPDPDTIDLMHVYAESFYRLVAQHIQRSGIVVTQASSPHFTPRAFICIKKTLQAAGFSTAAYHNQVPTMGEWGWVLGMHKTAVDEQSLRDRLLLLDFSMLETKFLNNDAMISMLHFGKGIFDSEKEAAIEINTQLNPVLHRYYLDASWGVY